MKNYIEPLKIAFIGGALNSAIGYTHYIASQMDHLFVLSAGCFSRDYKINNQTAIAWGVKKEHLYTDWKELLEKEILNIDAIIILTPTPSHFEIIMKALELGYAVISEKAIVSDYSEGFMVLEQVRKYNSFMAVTHNYTGYPMIRELQHMIKNGKLGKIININIEMPQESFIKKNINDKDIKPQEWRLEEGKITGISLDLGAHLQHMVYFLTGENPTQLVSDLSSFGSFAGIVDNLSALLRYKSGMKSQMWYGKSMLGHRNGLKVRVYGTKGSAEWFQMQPEELLFNTLYGERVIIDRASPDAIISKQKRYNRFKSGHPAGFIEAFGNLYVDIAEKLVQYKLDKNYKIDWAYDPFNAVKGLEVFEAMQKSSMKDRWIDLRK